MTIGASRFNARDAITLTAFVVLCYGVAATAGIVTASSVKTWYQTLNHPSFRPPDWLFAPVWLTLYGFIAIAGWRVWRKAGFERGRTAMILWSAQLVLNFAWSFIFFGAEMIGLALVEILILFGLIIGTILAFRPIDRLAALLLAPYAAWVGFASVLNFSLWYLN